MWRWTRCAPARAASSILPWSRHSSGSWAPHRIRSCSSPVAPASSRRRSILMPGPPLPDASPTPRRSHCGCLLDKLPQMLDGVGQVIEGARSAVGLVEAAVQLAVESAAVKWCAFLVADGTEDNWHVVHGGGSGAPAIGTRLSEADLTALDRSDPESALYFR